MSDNKEMVLEDLGMMDIATTAMSPDTVTGQVQLIQQMMKGVMKEDTHFGVIPGCKQPSLYKSGAEKLSMVFRMAPAYEIKEEYFENNHRGYNVLCRLTHLPSGKEIAQGVGYCSTMESKYRYRNADKEFTDRPVPKDYWTLRKSDPNNAQALLGGKGFGTGRDDAGQWFITKLSGKKTENENPADQYNTCLKMAKKRAHVDAVLTGTAASDIFTQDVEDMDFKVKSAKAVDVEVVDEKPKTTQKEDGKQARRITPEEVINYGGFVACVPSSESLNTPDHDPSLPQHGSPAAATTPKRGRPPADPETKKKNHSAQLTKRFLVSLEACENGNDIDELIADADWTLFVVADKQKIKDPVVKKRAGFGLDAAGKPTGAQAPPMTQAQLIDHLVSLLSKCMTTQDLNDFVNVEAKNLQSLTETSYKQVNTYFGQRKTEIMAGPKEPDNMQPQAPPAEPDNPLVNEVAQEQQQALQDSKPNNTKTFISDGVLRSMMAICYSVGGDDAQPVFADNKDVYGFLSWSFGGCKVGEIPYDAGNAWRKEYTNNRNADKLFAKYCEWKNAKGAA